jgi:DNA-binding transcriptional regulator YdaS (Cro superfamily)
MNLKDWANQTRGRQAALAAFLNVPAPNVCSWVSGQKQPSIKTAVAIEQFTGGEVTRKDLFPTDWQQIWPELAQAPAQSTGSSV